MSRPPRFAVRVRLWLLVLAGIAACARSPARADDLEPHAAPVPDTDEAVTTRKEILQTIMDVQRKYGADAVLLEGHLMGHAIRGGSILETAVSIPGVEDRDGKRFLAFKVETGIVYNDREMSATARPAHAWSEVVEASLRKFKSMSVPADGVVFLVGYTHKPYTDEADLRAHLDEGRGDPEALAFYLLLSDISELLADHITAQQLVDRSTVLVNGASSHLVLTVPTPTIPATKD